jgi:hypothetical protein
MREPSTKSYMVSALAITIIRYTRPEHLCLGLFFRWKTVSQFLYDTNLNYLLFDFQDSMDMALDGFFVRNFQTQKLATMLLAFSVSVALKSLRSTTITWAHSSRA